MVNLARHFPLPFSAQHHVYTPGAVNEDGNPFDSWAAPVSVACVWWSPSSVEPQSAPVNGARVVADVVLAVDSDLVVGSRDYFTIVELMDAAGDPLRLDVIGFPKDYDHGPFGFAPGRRIVELKAVTG